MEGNMKINSITTHTGYLNSKTSERMLGRERECVQNLKQMKNDQINTTIESNSDGRVSFKGKGTPLLHKIANFASDNPMVAEAAFAIVVTCFMRPLTIMATARTDEEKEKCTYQAAKSVSTGVVGLAMSMLVGAVTSAGAKLAQGKNAFKIPEGMQKGAKELVKLGTDNLTKKANEFAQSGEHKELVKQIKEIVTPEKIDLGKLKEAGFGAEKKFRKTIQKVAPDISESVKIAIKQQKTLDNFEKTGKNVIDKMFQPIFMPIRATVTIALVPVILKALGLKKTSNKPKEAEQTQQMTPQSGTTNFGVTNYKVFQSNYEKDLFNSFSGMVKNENK